MKKVSKINVSERNIIKTLDVISCYTKTHNGQVPIDDDFYNALSFMKKEQVVQTLNAMSSRGLIETFGKKYPYNTGHLKLTDGAFVYKLDNKHRIFRFWFPIIVSLISLIGSFREELMLLFSYLVKI